MLSQTCWVSVRRNIPVSSVGSGDTTACPDTVGLEQQVEQSKKQKQAWDIARFRHTDVPKWNSESAKLQQISLFGTFILFSENSIMCYKLAFSCIQSLNLLLSFQCHKRSDLKHQTLQKIILKQVLVNSAPFHRLGQKQGKKEKKVKKEKKE